jgi:MFS family permease
LSTSAEELRAQAASPSMFSAGYKRYALAGLTAVWMLNLVDRALMMLLLQPIKEDLKLSDTQLGLLTGIAFGLFYAVFGLPVARWADRGNRVTITSIAIGLWGVTVMSCLFVTNYVQLALARVAAAIGESGCKPPTYSLVGDYFPEVTERTRAMAIYMAGGPLAALVSFIVGGWLNELYGWRMTFFLMGIPGLALAVLVKLSIVEPRSLKAERVETRKPPAMKEILRILWRQRSCRHLCIALILLYTMGYGLGPWYAAFLMRSHGMGTAEVGLWLGLIISLGGMGGILAGSYFANRWFTGDERAQMRFAAATMVLLVPCFVAFLTLPDKHQALMAFVPLQLVLSAFTGPTYVLMQRLVVDDMRATMMAVIMLLTNLLGMGIGPQLVGVLSDLLMPMFAVDSLRYAMLLTSLIALWSAYHFGRVSQTVRADLSTMAPVTG